MPAQGINWALLGLHPLLLGKNLLLRKLKILKYPLSSLNGWECEERAGTRAQEMFPGQV